MFFKQRTITQTAGLAAYPTVLFECVTAGSEPASDTASVLSCKTSATVYSADGTSSSICTAANLATGCTRTLTVVSTGTSITTYCSQVTDGNKNIPTSCYIGLFSVTSTTAVSTANSNQFCIVYI